MPSGHWHSSNAGERIPTVALLPRNDKGFGSGSVYRPPLSLRGLFASRGNPFPLLNVILRSRKATKNPHLKKGILRLPPVAQDDMRCLKQLDKPEFEQVIEIRKELHMLKNLAKLIKVKTITTLMVLTVFSVLAFRGDIDPQNVMLIVSMVISFYFGTQHEKANLPQ